MKTPLFPRLTLVLGPSLATSLSVFASCGMGSGVLLWSWRAGAGMMLTESLRLSALSTFPVLPLGSLAQLATV